MRRNNTNYRSGVEGFTMGEMVIVLAVIAILAAMIAPLAVNQITQARYDACREELQIIKQGIAGDPSLIEGGIRSSFGYIGDIGLIPASLQELVINPGLQDWQPVGAPSYLSWGWRGPYVSEVTDSWGRPYAYQVRVTTVSDHTRIAIWSLGPDGVDNSLDDIMDDILGAGDRDFGDDSAITRIYQDELYSSVSGNVMDPCGAQAPCSGAEPTTITIYYPAGAAGIQPLGINLNLGSPIFDTGATTTPQLPIGIRSINATINYTDALGNQTDIVNRLIFLNNGPMTSVNIRPAGACN